MTTLHKAAQQALEALEFLSLDFFMLDPISPGRESTIKAITALKTALAEDAMQRLTDVQQEMERNFCPRCGKRTNDIHTCMPPHEEHFCDTHCTWLDHAPGCVRAEPVAWLFTNLQSGDYDFCYREDEHDHDREMWHKQSLYAAPPQRKPLTDEEILKAIGWDRAEMYMKLTPNFPVAEAKKETLKNARAIERAHGIGGSDE